MAAPGYRRYDTLPPSLGYAETSLAAAHPQYAQSGGDTTFLQRQYTAVLEPSVTPASLGVMPAPSRSTGTRLQDPLTPDELKPKKRERVNLFMPEGDDQLASRYTPAHLELYERTLESSKSTQGHGALDGYRMTPEDPDNPDNALRNFGAGEQKDFGVAASGFHPRLRITYVGEVKRGRLETSFRFGNPSHAVGKTGSIFQTGTAPIGAVRLAENADVREEADGRAPMPGGGVAGGLETRSTVSLLYQNRDNGMEYSRKEGRARGAGCEAPTYNPDVLLLPNTEREYAGPAGRQNGFSDVRADLSHQVRGHHAANTELAAFGNRGNAGTGAYAAADLGTQLQDHATHREGMSTRVHAEPVPFRGGGVSSYVMDREQRQPSGVREVYGRAAGGSSSRNLADLDRVQTDTQRCNHRSDAAFAQAHNFGQEMPARLSSAMQRPETDFAHQEHRRVAPFLQQQIDRSVQVQLANNPYVQPLPPL